MAQALGWDRVASFYIDLEALVPPSGIPKPGPLQMNLPDDHMPYAIIWFSLAGLLLIAFAVSLRGRMPALPDVGSWQIVLQKSFWGGERKFSGTLTRVARSDVRDHVVPRKNDRGPA
ncbi:MAG: hypothetical protein ACJ8EL_06340 [Rhizomicrobium sp.]